MYVLKTKSDAFNVFLKWKKMIEIQTEKKIKHLITDNGGKFHNDQFLKLCQDGDIVHHFIVRDTPQQNGVTERMNRTLLEKVRCMLFNVGLGKEFWVEVVTYACHLLNRLSSTAIDDRISSKVWSRLPYSCHHFHMQLFLH